MPAPQRAERDAHPAAHAANRLAASTSPYLLQHAHNPVNWWPWCDEAHAEARTRNVPIFLSIGYSTCYWCHVMERESFEDADTARTINERFVAIKLDREERPDLDEVYMAATIAMSGHGGWPMSVFLEPDTLRPFFCGTYFPREPMHGRPSFRNVLTSISDAFSTRREDVRTQAAALAAEVRDQCGEERAEHAHEGGPSRADSAVALLRTSTIEETLGSMLAIFDRANGGFGVAPKFPQCSWIEFLLGVRTLTDGPARQAVDLALRTTLDAMAVGGLHDHAGGGFHRYSVDALWTVPHFEKMLYDQAQMLSIYARASAALNDPWYAHVARRIIACVERNLTNADGTLRSAIDAECDGVEGKGYVWTPESARVALRAELPEQDADRVLDALGLLGGANFHEPVRAQGDEPREAWVLRLRERPDAVASKYGVDSAVWLRTLDAGLAVLQRVRTPRPRVDDKSIASWSGMYICALSAAAGALGDASLRERAGAYLSASMRAMRTREGLMRTARGGVAHTPAFLEDYAWLARGALGAGDAALGAELVALGAALFRDPVTGSWADARVTQRDLFVRACSTHDGATPCGFATMVHAMLDLHDAGTEGAAAQAIDAIASMSQRIAASPTSSVHSVHAVLRLHVSGALAQQADAKKPARARSDQGASKPAKALAQGPALQPARSTDWQPVEVFAEVNQLTLAAEEPREVEVLVRIAPGFHLVAADAGESDAARALRPFRVAIVGGGGVRAYADYPAGSAWTGAPGHEVRVYEGEFTLRIALERDGAWTGKPMLVVWYQACDDKACLAPAALELDIGLDRA